MAGLGAGALLWALGALSLGPNQVMAQHPGLAALGRASGPGLVGGVPSPTASRPPIRAEAEWFYLNGSVAFPLGSRWELGPEIGFGMGDYVDFGNENFIKFTHVGALLSRKLGSRVALDLGVQGGLGEFRPPECADLFGCYSEDPEWFGGLITALSVGGVRWRFGTRVSAFTLEGKVVGVWTPLFGVWRF